MKKFIEWMHGKGRNAVMVIVALLALGIVLHYFIVERDGYIGSGKPNPTVSPQLHKDSNLGGDSIGPAAEQTQEPAQTEKPIQTAEPTQTPEADSTIHLGFAGDICLDETSLVMRHMKEKGGLSKVISPKLIQKMKGYDCMVINNEFSISKQGSPMEGKLYTFRSSPSNVKYLKQLGVDVAGLANNHIYDYGRAAFLDTLSYLKKAGIQTVGAGKNKREAKKPVYLTIKNKTIAIVAATRAEKYILTPEAGKNSPGVFRTYDDTEYVKAIRKAKKKADYVIAYVHWGTEYSTELEDAQVSQAKDYINAGADAVVGAHTHCLQGVGYYKGVPIFYSLGNFWFNEKTLYTTVLEIDITQSGRLRAAMLPCLQKGMETKLLTKKEKKQKFVDYVNSISANARLNKKGRVLTFSKKSIK
jgi:poly-gamma-glutamate synthesis protein (capsule biosynthesis protein)